MLCFNNIQALITDEVNGRFHLALTLLSTTIKIENSHTPKKETTWIEVDQLTVCRRDLLEPANVLNYMLPLIISSEPDLSQTQMTVVK